MFLRKLFAPVQRVFVAWSDPTDWKEAYKVCQTRITDLEDQLYRVQSNIKTYLDSLNNPGAVDTGAGILTTANDWGAAQTFNSGVTTIASVDINDGFIDGVVIGSAIVYCTASGTGSAAFRLPHGVAPTAPENGDLWTTTAGLYVHIDGITYGPIS